MAKTNLTLVIVIIALALIFFNGNVTGNALYSNILNKYKVQGSFNSADCNQIKGYTCYPAASSMALTVYLQEGTSVKATSTANKAYPATSSCTQNHGFTITTPTALKDGRSHSLSIYALDPLKNVKVLISGSPKSINCAAPVSCTDGIKNGAETDVDCGGSSCPKCIQNKICNINSDCQSGNCWSYLGSSTCQAPTITSCSDSDGGFVINVYGNKTTVWSNGTVGYNLESCASSTNVIEYYCGNSVGASMNCNNATAGTTQCLNGACA